MQTKEDARESTEQYTNKSTYWSTFVRATLYSVYAYIINGAVTRALACRASAAHVSVP